MIKIFADGASLEGIAKLNQNPLISGFTSNPTLFAKAGVTNYEAHAREMVKAVAGKSLSLEVLSDDLSEMIRQAEKIASWGDNIYVKIPIMNTRGWDTLEVIYRLLNKGIKVNITAVMTWDQVIDIAELLNDTPSYVSIFAGRIADTGVNPEKIVFNTVELLKSRPAAEVIWASPRELYNITQAQNCGCHIITVFHDLLMKYHLIGKDLFTMSLDTVKMFYEDAKKSGYTL